MADLTSFVSGMDRGFAIVPRRSVASRTLVLLIAIMTFLSCVALGVVLLVQQSASAWSADIGREVTIELLPVEGQVMESNLRTAVALAEATRGVASARAVTLEESADLLAPWLGEGFDMDALPVPRLVIVRLADPENAALDELSTNIANAIPGARLETHELWRSQLNAVAGTVVLGGIAAFVLTVAATLLAVVFATRGTMASNREIVDVLHFIGASNEYIAAEFQGRFLALGLKGGAIGWGATIVFFFMAGFLTNAVLPVQSASQVAIFFGAFLPGLTGFFALLLVVLLIAGLTAITSRLTVQRFLATVSE